jgi:lysine 2,3-aminomutase
MTPPVAPAAAVPPAPWQAASAEAWGDWRWQMANRLRSVAELARRFALTDQEAACAAADGRAEADRPPRLRVGVTPYFAGLADPADAACPIRAQVVPRAGELAGPGTGRADPLDEDAFTPVPGLVHRHPDRALMLVGSQCAAYCRFCTRARLVGRAGPASEADLRAQLDYLRGHPGISEVILSGGDPLLLADRRLDRILTAVRAVPHVDAVRVHTRVPVVLPMRVTPALAAVLARHRPLWVNVHVNHRRELAPEVAAALRRLADAGLSLGSQSVLLAGVNDTAADQEALWRALRRLGIRPYYLFHCDPVAGAEAFRTPLARGAEILEAVRGRIGGLSLPTYVVDRPGRQGKRQVVLDAGNRTGPAHGPLVVAPGESSRGDR